MSIIGGGNLISKSSFHLHYRLVLLPWMKRGNCSVRCLKDRQYGSSIPLRYIPKKLRESEKPENFAGSDTQTPNLDKKSRGVEKGGNVPRSDTPSYDKFSGVSGSNSFGYEMKDGVKVRTHGSAVHGVKLSTRKHECFDNLHLDEKPDSIEEMGYGMGSFDSQCIEELEEVDEELDVCDVKAQEELRLKECKSKLDAQKAAVELLAARAFTAMELRKKLQAKRFPPSIIDDVLYDFQERGLLNDSLYAEAYSRSRWSSSCWGPRRIKHALLKKGVNQVDSENAVKLVFEDGEDDDQHLQIGLSKSSMDQLYVQASKQWLRSQDAPRDTRKARIIRWLQYRGFNWGVVSAILKKLESQYSP